MPRNAIALSLTALPHQGRLATTTLVLSGALMAGAAGIARAHDAPSGWSYPFSCCSGYDCRPVSTKAISTGPSGYVIGTTGEVVGYADRRVRYSPDGEYHWCSTQGKEDGHTICLFVPPQLY